ncbi:hypothetical protein EDC02_2757 [Micromonospora sp. Llam0]|nr:hypothetical protein EDC02_2757 [Micromonospora sp. Llam0]
MPSPVTSVTTRRFPPERLVELVHDVIYEITDPRNLLPAERRPRSFAREQRQPGRRYPRQKDEYKKPLPPRTKIRLWVTTSQDP